MNNRGAIALVSVFLIALVAANMSATVLGVERGELGWVIGLADSPGLCDVEPTPYQIDFYSMDSTICSMPMPAGTVINAYDPQGVHCGTANAFAAGQWGIMHVYGDDPLTTTIDEGAVAGDLITFYVTTQAGAIRARVTGNAVWADKQMRVLTLEVCPPTVTLTPTNTQTPSVTPMPSNTPVPTNTLRPSLTPTVTDTPLTKYIYGHVESESGERLGGAKVGIYRGGAGTWTLIQEAEVDLEGQFGFGVNPTMTTYRLVETDPTGYESFDALLATAVTGHVVDANTLEFSLPDGPSAGEFVFVDRHVLGGPGPGDLYGHVWIDLDGDGDRQDGEGLVGVFLMLDGPTSLTGLASWVAATDATGRYEFTGLVPGRYTVSVTDPLGRVPDQEISVDGSNLEAGPIEQPIQYWLLSLSMLFQQS